ncbi:hypothetical protein, partial [Candidatus Bathycorpusculum sp.]|uniref:hypothetical protein n=1 Tax=Candidatus Bathycorpusculum sp. TaxID=2994959 RepID=UPI002820DD1A|nr:hypothetical protein [Candidatus Termitimicrobium sp.]MCL2685249.1 hypothetical protein [Candidatus Termitimicrobium sp.]
MSVRTEFELRNAINNATAGVSAVITLANDIQLTGSSLVISANQCIKLISAAGVAGGFFRLIGV